MASLVNGPYGIRDVCISVPTVLGRSGVVSQLEIDLWAKEVSALKRSAEILRERDFDIEIIEAHHGHLTASPRDGGGTAFRLTLPKARQDEAANAR